jgi:hypothetical protein
LPLFCSRYLCCVSTFLTVLACDCLIHFSCGRCRVPLSGRCIHFCCLVRSPSPFLIVFDSSALMGCLATASNPNGLGIFRVVRPADVARSNQFAFTYDRESHSTFPIPLAFVICMSWNECRASFILAPLVVVARSPHH